MEFPFDLSLIWLSLILSMILLMAYVTRCSYLPSFQQYQGKTTTSESFHKVELPISFFLERFHHVFRKIPTKEIGSNSLDEEQPFSFSKMQHLMINEEEFIYGVKGPIAHIEPC